MLKILQLHWVFTLSPNTGGLGYDYAQGLSGGRASGDPCQKLGVDYKTPTRQQYMDLVASGASAWATYNGVNGYFFGPNAATCDNTTLQVGCIFFPAAGLRGYRDGTQYFEGERGHYWSSSVYRNTLVHFLWFDSGSGIFNYDTNRGEGFSVRCVQE